MIKIFKKITAKISYFFLIMAPSVAAAQLVPPLVSCGRAGQPACDFDAFIGLIKNIMDFAITTAPFLAAIAFAFAGFYYFTSAGDPGKVETAHDIFRNTAIGLIIILAAWFVVKAILVGLGVTGDFNLLN
ncbi:MAG: hypothetical protein NUV42_01145 [Candidatus Yonathbacteria bacterium]|nr:hypothetical protein [Candidatus Yonathbacteria bacterium]